MGNRPATTFFAKLEQEAKLAGLHDKEDEKDHLTRAARLGIPISIRHAITGGGLNVPHTYP